MNVFNAWTVHVKMVKMVNCMLHIHYHKFFKSEEQRSDKYVHKLNMCLKKEKTVEVYKNYAI